MAGQGAGGSVAPPPLARPPSTGVHQRRQQIRGRASSVHGCVFPTTNHPTPPEWSPSGLLLPSGRAVARVDQQKGALVRPSGAAAERPSRERRCSSWKSGGDAEHGCSGAGQKTLSTSCFFPPITGSVHIYFSLVLRLQQDCMCG